MSRGTEECRLPAGGSMRTVDGGHGHGDQSIPTDAEAGTNEFNIQYLK